MAELILGIDPGLSGAVALYDPVAKSLIQVWDMPVTRIKTAKGKNRSRIDLAELTRLFSDLFTFNHCPQRNLWVHTAVLEEVTAAPGQGATSMFNFGMGYGMLRGILSALQIPTLLVRPGVWKPAMGLSGDKKRSLAHARGLFGPEHFTLQKHDGRAEASLLAFYGARAHKTTALEELY